MKLLKFKSKLEEMENSTFLSEYAEQNPKYAELNAGYNPKAQMLSAFIPQKSIRPGGGQRSSKRVIAFHPEASSPLKASEKRTPHKFMPCPSPSCTPTKRQTKKPNMQTVPSKNVKSKNAGIRTNHNTPKVHSTNPSSGFNKK
jgi:hypothetical protein